jgi:DNA-binding transcriptional ArsR family regulator
MSATGASETGWTIAELGRALTALGDPVRQEIVTALSRERLNVGQLAGVFRSPRPAISHHLKSSPTPVCSSASAPARARLPPRRHLLPALRRRGEALRHGLLHERQILLRKGLP